MIWGGAHVLKQGPMQSISDLPPAPPPVSDTAAVQPSEAAVPGLHQSREQRRPDMTPRQPTRCSWGCRERQQLAQGGCRRLGRHSLRRRDHGGGGSRCCGAEERAHLWPCRRTGRQLSESSLLCSLQPHREQRQHQQRGTFSCSHPLQTGRTGGPWRDWRGPLRVAWRHATSVAQQRTHRANAAPESLTRRPPTRVGGREAL